MEDPNAPVRIAPDESAAAAAAGAMRGFSADFYRALAASQADSNIVCSPYSVAVALAMTRAGARGRTATEMDTVLHAPQPRPTALDAGLNALDQLMVASYADGGDGTKRPQLAVASSLWAQLDLSLRPEFQKTLAGYYGADVHRVDFFRAVEDARRQINTWISDRTNEKIPELLAQDVLTPDALLVLANAIYLKASWQYPFPKSRTVQAAFTRDDGRVVSVPMMGGGPAEQMGYLEGDGWVAVDIPYVGYQLAMAVVVPTGGKLARLEGTLNDDWLTKLLLGFRTTYVELRLPRWTFRLPTDLGELLAGLGMPTAFSNGADFSGITTDTRLCIDKVVHEAFIAVDEKGTEAAAATAVIIRPPSVPVSKPVRVDRPFLFVIHDVERGVPLFVGRVGDPSITAA